MGSLEARLGSKLVEGKYVPILLQNFVLAWDTTGRATNCFVQSLAPGTERGGNSRILQKWSKVVHGRIDG